MNRLTIVLLLIFSISLSSISSTVNAQLAQTINISSSPNPVGSGARALGMGGAFIGVADDATAASWNPGGLIQLETPEVSMVGAYNHRTEDTTYIAFPEASGPQKVTTFEINYFSLAYPFTVMDWNMIVSLNYQHLYDFHKKVGFGFNQSSPTLTLQNKIDYEQEGALRTVSPAFAIQLTPKLSIGFTLNFWEDPLDDNTWESTQRLTGSGTFTGLPIIVESNRKERYEMNGWNYHLGFLWYLNSTFTLGGVFKAPFSAKIRYDHEFSETIIFPTAPASNSASEIRFSEDQLLDMPMSYGVGLAARLSDALTFDMDIYRTEWGDYVLHRADGTAWNPITGGPASEANVDATTQIRAGGEYLIIGERMVVPLRAGIFYDPEPSQGSPEDFWGISLGTGIVHKRFIGDIAYQYRFGRNVRTSIVGDADSHQDVDQHTVYMSVIYHF